MKIERPVCLSCPFAIPGTFFFCLFLKSTSELGGFMLYKQYWKEWLDVAKHIWAHLDWIAHGPSNWVSVSQAVAMFGTLCRCLIVL